MGRAQTRCHLQFVWFFASVCKLSSYHFSLVPVERAMTATRERASSIRVPHHCRLGSDSNLTDSSLPNYFRCFMRPRGGSAGVQYRRTDATQRKGARQASQKCAWSLHKTTTEAKSLPNGDRDADNLRADKVNLQSVSLTQRYSAG